MSNRLITTFIAAAVACGALFAGAGFFLRSLPSLPGRPGVRVDATRASVVQQMARLHRLETASFTIEKIIEAGTDGNALQEILYGDRILLIAHGQVVAGFDLSNVGEEDVSVSGQSLTLRLPPPEILFVRLDSSRTRVYDRKLGFLSRGDKDLESHARRVAEDSIRAAACESGILEEAAASARSQLQALFESAGFREVSIEIPGTECN
jgi:hypothetical protein